MRGVREIHGIKRSIIKILLDGNFGGGTAKDAIFEQQSLHLAQKALSCWTADFALRRAADMLANGKTMGAETRSDASISVSRNDGRI